MSETKQTFSVLHYARYLGSDGNSVYNYQDFCGACRQHLPSPYEFPKEPEALEDEGDWHSFGDGDRELAYFSYCPWCGVEFNDKWWRGQPIQNERVIDHYENPGTHKGDTHQFCGDGPDCINGHWLGTTGTEVCWCDPEVIPSLMGCVIKHQNKNYEQVMAHRREIAEAEDEAEEWDEWDDE